MAIKSYILQLIDLETMSKLEYLYTYLDSFHAVVVERES